MKYVSTLTWPGCMTPTVAPIYEQEVKVTLYRRTLLVARYRIFRRRQSSAPLRSHHKIDELEGGVVPGMSTQMVGVGGGGTSDNLLSTNCRPFSPSCAFGICHTTDLGTKKVFLHVSSDDRSTF